MRRRPLNRALPSVLSLALVAAAGCRPKEPPQQHFYEQHIQPIFNTFCISNTSPCHSINPDTKVALGNLDLTSFDGVQKRRDLLRTYGSYPQPVLLLKVIPEKDVLIPYRGKLLPSEIRHAGGKPISQSSDAYYDLKRWLDAGANRDGVAPVGQPNQGSGSCSTVVPESAKPVTVDTTARKYADFVANVQPKLMQSCAFASCHSSPQSDFYLTCGSDDEQLAFNFQQASGFIAAKPTAVEQSELLLRPLAPAAGGVSHTGGVYFQSRDDDTWKAFRDWALEVQDDPPEVGARSAGQQFFEDNVMPKLLQRGCAFEGCHSPDGFNDYRLRSGALGFFAPAALRRNYESTLLEFMALDTPDVRQSRAVKKTIFATSGGTLHRGGPLLEDGTPATEPCPATFDPAAPDNRAFCVFKEWHRIERTDRAADVSPMPAGGTLPLAVVARPPDGDSLLEFDTFRGGADLLLGTVTVDATGAVTAASVGASALGACQGLTPGAVDVRGPEWSYDGSKVVFAARPTAASGLDLWLLDVAGGTCRKLTNDDGRLVNGVRVHNFDPVFAPDGSVVFASTRAGTLTLKVQRQLPNANLYRVGPSLDFGNPQQMTFLLNSEIGPAFMQDGRVTFTAEKATAEFYQLSGRRMNWDLTDYHPLLAQRATSTDTFTKDLYPSVGYQQATDIREGLDRNFLLVLSDDGAKGGGGALATFNRSIGPFEADRTEVTFLRSLTIVDAAATGRAGTAGVYRSPFSLPNGEILTSYAANVTDPTADVPRYDLVAVADGGARRMLASGGARSYVEAVVGYKRAGRLLFQNLPQLVFGGHSGETADNTAVMHFPDVPVLATLLGANLRRGRDVDALDVAAGLKFYEERPPPGPTASGSLVGTQQVYEERRPLGWARFERDRSLKVVVPANVPLILELVDGVGRPVLTMTEEHQVAQGEYITPGPPRKLFDNICGGCHGSLSGLETDVAVSADALTGASQSMSRYEPAKTLQP